MRVSHRLATLLFCSLLSASAFAERAIVQTKDGQVLEGEIVQETDTIVVVRQGIRTRVHRDDIASMRPAADPATMLQQDAGKLKPDDVAGRLSLSRRAFQLRQYEMARKLANDALMIDSNSREAVDMIDLVRRQVLMESRSAAAANAQRTQRTIGGVLDGSLALPVKLMDERDINAVRQAELQASDEQNVRVRFNNDVRRRYVATLQNTPERFAELSAFQQARVIIQEGTPEMRQDVLIQGDPASVRTFKGVQKYILSGCAATQCHGSMAGGNFILYPLADSDAVTYTNFYLLQKYARINREAPKTVFGGAGARIRMIDRQRPAQSLLLQYGLPVEMAETPHPKVPGFRPMFSSRDDAIYRRVGAWIEDGLAPIDAKYNVTYVSPVEALSRPDEQPSASESTKPTTTATKPSTAASLPAPATQPAAPVSRPVIPMPPLIRR